MRIEIKGNIPSFCLQDVIEEAVEAWFTKLSADNPEIAEGLNGAEAINVTGFTVDLAFKIAGVAEPQVLTTDNHEGIPELLVVTAETDSQGNLLWESVKDNDGDSLFSEAEALIATGLTGRREDIVSDYLDTEFHKVERVRIDSDTFVDIMKSQEETVVQVYDSAQPYFKLFAEVAFPVEEYDNLVTHYKKLAEVTAE